MSFNPGATENSVVIAEKLIPRNVRLTNSSSSGNEFAGAGKTINSFLRKWSIAGASVAISIDGKLQFADRKSTRLNSSHPVSSRMPSSA